MKEKPVERMEYPETPPWTMFFDGPLYQKYDEFMKNKDFSKILLNTKLRLANSTNSGGDVVSSTFSTDDDRWDKDVDDPTGSTYQYVSPDYYKRARSEEKRRTRRTRALILLGILVMAALAFGSALVIHYFFVPSAEERNPANTVNVSFAINTTDEFPEDVPETTTKSDVDDEIAKMFDAISKAGQPTDHDHGKVLNPDGKIFDETFDITTTVKTTGSGEQSRTTSERPETKRLESTTNAPQTSSFTEDAMYELHLIPDTSSADVRRGSDVTPTKSLEIDVTPTARSKILEGISPKPVSSTKFDPMDFFAMDDYFASDNSSTTESYLDNLFLDPTSQTKTTPPPLTTSQGATTLAEEPKTNMTQSTATVTKVTSTPVSTTEDIFAAFEKQEVTTLTDVTTWTDVTTLSETSSVSTSTVVDTTTNVKAQSTTLAESSTTLTTLPITSTEVTTGLTEKITTTMSKEMTTSYEGETTQQTQSSSQIMNTTETQNTFPFNNGEQVETTTPKITTTDVSTDAESGDYNGADKTNPTVQETQPVTHELITDNQTTHRSTTNTTPQVTNNNDGSLGATTITAATNAETTSSDQFKLNVNEVDEPLEPTTTTVELTTSSTTTTTTTTLPPDISVISMEDRTSYLYENTTIDCTVKHALHWKTLTIRENKKWRPLEITLHSSGSIEFSKTLKQRQDVTFDIKDNAAGTGYDVSISLVISKVQCKDAETFLCTLKSAYPDKFVQSRLVVVGKPSNSIQLTIGPSTIENKALRITASWQGGYPVPWTNMSWTAIDSNKKSYNLERYGEYRDRELHEDHHFCQTTLSHSIVIFPKLHLNGTRIVVKPDIQGKQYFVDNEMEQYLLKVKPGEDEILVIPKDYCGTVNKEKSIAHPYTPCFKFVRCLPGDLVVQLCPTGTCFREKSQECR